MAGRGRGKSAMSFSMEQLGISKGETLSTLVLQPSLSYPPLDHKPPPIQITSEMEYLIELKRHFTEYVRESPHYVKAAVINEDIERYSDAFKEDFTDNDESKYEAYHDRQQKGNKKKKNMDIVKKLSELEKKENMQHPVEEEDKEEGNEEENDEEKEDGVKEDEEDEMDDGTDYANEYFENGDNYYSEEDNNDDQFFDA
ncbi:DNA-directed RNA polymerase III subunit RPC7 [Acromyrmex echinatior]|uniref:DNA-directed RNA polymerase III subunit RPC7 n=1 Tax=Acromyrmex echinatior TaxID=103372 RepID=F4WQX6_ACREC|nr:DNA-directed RNA polymerase III subunit RPC7 [Acromyrmex echinatior]